MLVLLGFLYTLFRELGEHAKDNRFIGWGKWWNTDTSWVNKHRWGPMLLPWLPEWFTKWLFFSPLVWITDAEHFFQALATFAILGALLVSNGVLASVLYFYLGVILSGGFKEIFLKNVQ